MVRLRGRASQRGQGTTELALGLLLFVTILIFGIHFAEVGYLSLKVQEAATSALWDTTSAEMHTLPNDFKPLTDLINDDTPGKLATERYQDFDGRTSKTGRPRVVQLFTSAEGLEVTCRAAGGISFAPSRSTSGVYKDVGGMSCTAQAELSPVKKFTRRFLDRGRGAFFDVPHYTMGAIPVCGLGRVRGGECAGGFGILLDDWGLASAEESRECRVLDDAGCDNQAYYRSARKVYAAHLPGMGASQRLARSIVGQAPIDPGKFWMSFRGMDSGFQEKENGGDQDPNDWKTTPGAGSRSPEYNSSYSKRQNCFLGTCPP
ncbi:MAG TPA: pilus assembly protein [Archangium sp.]|uniref:pilus assembly protein n=1 Tax=Archangium sp. TaxID=1872627 RepID=UPI002E35C1EA|nr:pilus assembly protein [Archangium sp.]HEX5753173.1 pilus assembly protein [Archangium sp.]